MNVTPEENNKSILQVQDVHIGFGGLKVLAGISMDVLDGGITAMIGPNGAGKTVLFNCISGLYRPSEGSITFDGLKLVGKSASAIARAGIGRSFQNLELFPQLSVVENLLVARDAYFSGGALQAMMHLPKIRRDEIAQRDFVERVIDFFELWPVRNARAGDLAYGQQKIVGFARAMASSPKLLLLDEPGSGLTRDEKEDLARFILRLRNDWGVSILWVEHDLQMVMDMADRVHVLHGGECIASGKPEEVRNDPLVVAAYIGGYERVD